jgi:DNA-binding HxlR family transcriptional regulator
MKGDGQFCPVAKAAEIVAERWTPLVLRELLCGSRRFGELHRGVPLMSRALLAQRLAEFEDAGIVRSVPQRQGRGREYRTLTRVWMGDVPLAEALRAGSIRLDGSPSLVRAFPIWLRLSAFAGVGRVGAAVAAGPA